MRFKERTRHDVGLLARPISLSHLDLLFELRGAVASERRVPAQQQVRDDPNAPHVARSRKVGAADHLRRHVHLSKNRIAIRHA